MQKLKEFLMNSGTRAFVGLLLIGISLPVLGQGTKSDYQRSASLQQLFGGKVARDQVTPQWIGETGQFWYRLDLGEGRREYVRVDPARAERKAAFDHEKLAAALAKASGKEAKADRLAIERPDFSDPKRVTFTFDGKRWACDLETYTVEPGKAGETGPPETQPEQRGRRGGG